MSETCICCGAVIPEGRQVCPNCESLSIQVPDYCEREMPTYDI